MKYVFKQNWTNDFLKQKNKCKSVRYAHSHRPGRRNRLKIRELKRKTNDDLNAAFIPFKYFKPSLQKNKKKKTRWTRRRRKYGSNCVCVCGIGKVGCARDVPSCGNVGMMSLSHTTHFRSFPSILLSSTCNKTQAVRYLL